MPHRYFLNLRYRDCYFRDDEGDELENVDAARRYALSTARDMIKRTRTQMIRDWFDCSFEVTDAAGELVATVPFAETVTSLQTVNHASDVAEIG
ncbi:MAG: hypothetical protein EOO23_04500 [Comamonadaceae bacterium]|nr:MAG: hypothetical protein EOO23_04500 [Comamonadaceae bacterium]